MICVSVIEKSIPLIVDIANSSEMAEIRIDLCGLNLQTTNEVFSHIQKPTIATCRPDYCNDEQRTDLLKAAIEAGATYVDVEIESPETFKKQVMDFAKAHNCKNIISYHNYEKTPSSQELKTIVDDCFAQGADIAKIATMAQTKADSARVLSLYAEYSNIVALAMGAEGKITRIANLCLGSPFSFAAVSLEHISAQGQMTVQQMKTLRGILE